MLFVLFLQSYFKSIIQVIFLCASYKDKRKLLASKNFNIFCVIISIVVVVVAVAQALLHFTALAHMAFDADIATLHNLFGRCCCCCRR